jgi:DNA-binding NtrC family response regulator
LQPILSSALGKGFQVHTQPEEGHVSNTLAAGECDVVLLDLDSDQMRLEERLNACRRIVASKTPSIIMVDDQLRSATVDLVSLGAYGYCRKPPSIRDLKTLLRRAFEHTVLQRKLDQVLQSFEEVSYGCDRMIGHSSPMQQVYDLVNRVASVNASVLVTGKSGTGKELIAKAIHNLGSRSQRPFVAICCGAIPETLIEAELFGHEKSAFTGTVGTREGYLEQAGDGTLFLDEIGELSLSTQVKLLRVLQ